MVISELEKELQKSERKRTEIESKKAFAEAGLPIPGSPQETLQKIEEVKGMLSDMLEAKAFQRIAKVLDTVQSRVEVMKELKEFGLDINNLSTKFDDIMFSLKHIDSSLATMLRMLTAELDKQDTQRQLEKDTLSRLNDYLSNWL